MRELDRTSIAVKDTVAKKHAGRWDEQVPVRFAATGVQQLRVVAQFHRSDLLPDMCSAFPRSRPT